MKSRWGKNCKRRGYAKLSFFDLMNAPATITNNKGETGITTLGIELLKIFKNKFEKLPDESKERIIKQCTGKRK